MKAKYFYGYNIVGAGFLIQGVSYGAMFTYGVFFKEFQADFGWSRALISGASSLCFFLGGAFGILAGRLNDKIGPRVLTVCTSISLGIGYMLMSRLQAPLQLLGAILEQRQHSTFEAHNIGLFRHDMISG